MADRRHRRRARHRRIRHRRDTAQPPANPHPGIEIFTGVYEVEADVILNNVKDSDTAGHTEIWKSST